MSSRDRALALIAVLLVAVVLVLLVFTVSEARGNRATVRATICKVFGRSCHSAVRVALCETGGTLDPHARGAAGERGLFQIHPVHFGWVDERRLWQPLYNARIAFRLSRGGTSWRAWTCKP